MKLLFFSNTLAGGGAERVLANLTNELSRRGHDVTIALNINKIAYDLSDDIKVIHAPQYYLYKEQNILKRIYRSIIQKNNLHKFTKHVIDDIKPDIIITFLRCNMIPIIKYHKNITIISSEHNAYDRNIGFLKKIERFFLNRFFDKVFVLTAFDQGYAKAKGLSNTIIMPNPNTFDIISKDEYDEYFDKRKNILVCGRVYAWYVKGFDIAIKAFAKIAEKIPNTDLDIVGEYDQKSKIHLENIAIECGVEERVHFLGRSNDMINIMRNHKVFVLSSRTEGFPMVITEAMTQGLPCVSFERLSYPIIIDSIDGLLVDNGDIEKLANSIYELISNDGYRYLLGIESLKNINRFSSKNIAKRWENILITSINNYYVKKN